MKKGNFCTIKGSVIFKEGVENIVCLRRGKVNGVSVDLKKLDNQQIPTLIIKWLESDRESFLKLLKFPYNEKWDYMKSNGGIKNV